MRTNTLCITILPLLFIVLTLLSGTRQKDWRIFPFYRCHTKSSIKLKTHLRLIQRSIHQCVVNYTEELLRGHFPFLYIRLATAKTHQTAETWHGQRITEGFSKAFCSGLTSFLSTSVEALLFDTGMKILGQHGTLQKIPVI